VPSLLLLLSLSDLWSLSVSVCVLYDDIILKTAGRTAATAGH